MSAERVPGLPSSVASVSLCPLPEPGDTRPMQDVNASDAASCNTGAVQPFDDGLSAFTAPRFCG